MVGEEEEDKLKEDGEVVEFGEDEKGNEEAEAANTGEEREEEE